MEALVAMLYFFLLSAAPYPTRVADFFTWHMPVAVSQQDQSCPAAIHQLVQDPNWFDNLVNPVLNSESEITERTKAYTTVHSCLETRVEKPGSKVDASKSPLSAEEKAVYELTGYYLAFVVGEPNNGDAADLPLVDLRTTTDPAIVALREQAGVPAPRGLVFVRSYRSREAMPPLVREAFADPQVAGVTILSRYIAVLAEDSTSWSDQALQSKTLPVTISHELVHAYVNASLASKHVGNLPTWFNEGIAIYFSHSGENHSLMAFGNSLIITSPADYQQYELNFKYLEAMQGRARFLQLIRQSILNGDPSVLYQGLGISDDRLLPNYALSWKAGQDRSRLTIGVVILGALAFLALVRPWEGRAEPEYACACGYVSTLRNYPDGTCPQCERLAALARRVPSWRPAHWVAACEVCGRNYWLWQLRHLEQHPRRVPVWEDSGRGEADPRFATVHRICYSCNQRSQELGQAREQRMRHELELIETAASHVYAAWLGTAPPYPAGSSQRAQILTFDQAVQEFARAAISEKYAQWFDKPADFRLVGWANGEEALFTSPPAGYRGVLRKKFYAMNYPMQLSGSVYRLNQQLVLIEWALDFQNIS